MSTLTVEIDRLAVHIQRLSSRSRTVFDAESYFAMRNAAVDIGALAAEVEKCPLLKGESDDLQAHHHA